MNEAEQAARVSQRVKLRGVDAEVSRLGFGTSALMSRVGRRDSMRLLQAAWEEGITHLDTARSYGFGEAESVVGEFIQRRRDQITVTTKVGILPPPHSAWLSAAKAGARALITLVPSARKRVRQRAAHLLLPPSFDDVTMTRSVETSLRALGTTYVDFLLLHEPRPEVLRTHEPLAFLERMRAQGKVRFFGVATDLPGVLHVLSEQPELATVLQHPYDVFASAPHGRGSPSGGAVFAHSCLGRTLSKLRTRCADTSLLSDWSRSLGLDLAESGRLEQLTLLAAMNDLPHAAVLFTSTKVQHIRENAAALRSAASSEQVEHFRSLVMNNPELG